LPIYPRLTESEVAQVIEATRAAVLGAAATVATR